MIKNFIESFSGSILNKCPILCRKLLDTNKKSLRIIYYHMISDKKHDFLYPHNGITINEFKKQINYLKNHFTFISLREAIEIAESKKSLEGKLVLTVDDGFQENYSVIAPILLDYKIPATFFLLDKTIDNKEMMWRNKLMYICNKASDNEIKEIMLKLSKKFNVNYSKKMNLLDWSAQKWSMNMVDEYADFLWQSSSLPNFDYIVDEMQPYLNSYQVRELIGNGFEIGSHSMNHVFFNKLTYKQFKDEIILSRNALNKKFNLDVRYFAYPFGIRGNTNFENRFMAEHKNKIKIFLGNRNCLNNFFVYNRWERDNLEKPFNQMLFRLYLLPYLMNKIMIKKKLGNKNHEDLD